MSAHSDVERYRHSIEPIVRSWIAGYPNKSLTSLLNGIAQNTDCPILVVAYLIEEVKGKSPELQAIIESLESYYLPDKNKT